MSKAITDPKGFILDNTEQAPVPSAPEITLNLINDDKPLWKLSEEEIADLGLLPPFWAFVWAGGSALARYCLGNPDQFENKTILDFASGSGLLAIAALKAGAHSATACDIDPVAIHAMELNAQLNNIQFATTDTNFLDESNHPALLDNPPDILLAGDVFYDEEMTQQACALFDKLDQAGTKILVGDPERAYFPADKLTELEVYKVDVAPALEEYLIHTTKVFRYRA